MSTNFKIANAIFFQLGWFVCILTNNVISIGFTLAFVLVNFYSMYVLTKKLALKQEIAWLMLCLAVGFTCETVFFNSGILELTPAAALPISSGLTLPPIWLLCLWILFAQTLRTSLSFIFSKPLITCLLALLFAPCNYFAGANLNADVGIGQPLLLNLGLIGLAWALALGSLIAIHRSYFKLPD